MRGPALILAVLALTACQTRPIVPKVVKVVVVQYVPLPASLLKDSDEVPKRENTVGESVRLANARLESVKKCNQDKAGIRKLQP